MTISLSFGGIHLSIFSARPRNTTSRHLGAPAINAWIESAMRLRSKDQNPDLSPKREVAAPHLWAVIGEYADEIPPQPRAEEHDETPSTQRSAQRDSADEL